MCGDLVSAYCVCVGGVGGWGGGYMSVFYIAQYASLAWLILDLQVEAGSGGCTTWRALL